MLIPRTEWPYYTGRYRICFNVLNITDRSQTVIQCAFTNGKSCRFSFFFPGVWFLFCLRCWNWPSASISFKQSMYLFPDKQLPSSKSFYLLSLPQQSPLLTKDEYFPSSHIFRNRLFRLLQWGTQKLLHWRDKIKTLERTSHFQWSDGLNN